VTGGGGGIFQEETRKL